MGGEATAGLPIAYFSGRANVSNQLDKTPGGLRTNTSARAPGSKEVEVAIRQDYQCIASQGTQAQKEKARRTTSYDRVLQYRRQKGRTKMCRIESARGSQTIHQQIGEK